MGKVRLAPPPAPRKKPKNNAPHTKFVCERHIRWCSSFWNMNYWLRHKDKEKTTELVRRAIELDERGNQIYRAPRNFCTSCWYFIGILCFWHQVKAPEIVEMAFSNPHIKEKTHE